MKTRGRWAAFSPAVILMVGAMGRVAIAPYGTRSLVTPLDSFPRAVATFEFSRELAVPASQRVSLRADDLLHREYRDPSGRALTVYVAFYGRQSDGRSIHSPSNCLPGSGWEAVESSRVKMRTVYGDTRVNRTLIEHGSGARALVYYWYQGRGRVAANEYRVKADLLRDAIVDRRTDEGLVRLVLPVTSWRELGAVDTLAAQAVPEVIDTLAGYLPG